MRVVLADLHITEDWTPSALLVVCYKMTKGFWTLNSVIVIIISSFLMLVCETGASLIENLFQHVIKKSFKYHLSCKLQSTRPQ